MKTITNEDFVRALKTIHDITDLEDMDKLSRLAGSKITILRETIGGQIRSQLYIGAKIKLKDKHCTDRKGSKLLGKIGLVMKLNPTKVKVKFAQSDIIASNIIWTIPYYMMELPK